MSLTLFSYSIIRQLGLFSKQLPAMFSLLVVLLATNSFELNAQAATDTVAKPKPMRELNDDVKH